MWHQRLELIRPALAHPPLSPERAAAINGAVAQSGVSERSLRRWLSGYEAEGIGGLTRAERSDKGGRLVIISRRWDRAVPFDDELKREIAAQVRRKARSLWAAGAPGWRHVQRLTTTKLVTLTREAGMNLPERDLLACCTVPRAFVEAERRYRLIAIKDKDAKRYSDRYVARVRRSRAGMRPMEIVAGDVHHVDVLARRPDGSTCTPKAITWHDLATNRVFVTIVFLEKGQGIRQEQVIASFIAMTQDPLWGMPGLLYLDNGGEYNWAGFIDDAMRLKSMAIVDGDSDPALRDEIAARRASMTVKSRPYRPQGKVIEGRFAALEGGAFRMLPGWIGGDRMAKKTANVGRDPETFEGGHDAFHAAIRVALDYYETHPQSGHLNGKSPREAFAGAVSAGWQRTDIDPDALRAVFAREVTRVVTKGAITFDGRVYRHEALATKTDARVRVRVPITGDRERLPVLDDNGHVLCIAEATRVYGFMDPAGARDQARMERELGSRVEDLRGDADALDLTAEMRAAAAQHPPAPTPESAGVIRLSDEIEGIGAAQKHLNPRAERDAALDQQRKQYAYIANLGRRSAGQA